MWLIYEYLLTLDQEIRVVWHMPRTGATYLFIVNRYTALVAALFTVLSENLPVRGLLSSVTVSSLRILFPLP